MSAPATTEPSPLRAVLLPPPAGEGDLTVSAALKRRTTTRAFRPTSLPAQLLSDLLWAACGVNREVGPFGGSGRTAASASNSQEIDVYVALDEGTYLYDAVGNRLTPIVGGDLRGEALTLGQRMVGPKAPVQLVYVVDIEKLTHTTGFQEPGLHDGDIQKSYYYVDTGIIAANVYLFAAAQGLGAWFHNCDRPGLAAALRLRDGQRVLFAQSVGYPAGS
ncbi:nitroreductase family protein [Labrys monachus]|uniref:Nitroreductase n=1 Tax=Labrys monachus TaxID=217067 RepID=A0ABU0F8Z2_9HYPH|nr:nitroreductase family protein [Labrys monachus]MDQ0391077.1 nitroreductase [Labrys monachus]